VGQPKVRYIKTIALWDNLDETRKGRILTFVVQRLALLSHSHFSRTKLSKVLGSFRNRVAKETHDNSATLSRVFDFDIKKDLGRNLFKVTERGK
jgi:hypothetical protein